MSSQNKVAIMSILIALVALLIIILSASFIISSSPDNQADVDNLIDPLASYTPSSSAGYSTPNFINIYGGSSSDDDDDDDDDDGEDPEIDLWASSMDVPIYGFFLYDLDYYSSDEEDDHDELEFDIISPTTDTVFLITLDDVSHVLGIWPTGSVGESATLTIEVEDTDGNTDRDSVVLTIVDDSSGDYSPHIAGLPDIAFGEDGSDSSIDLDDYVFDADNLDSELTWSFSGNTDVQITIDSDNVVYFTATPEWSGAEFITFRVEDPDGHYDEDVILVTVTPVDDPAVWNVLVDQSIMEDSPDGTLIYPNLLLQATDIDSVVVMSVVTVSPHFDLAFAGNDLIINNLEANWFGNTTIILDANGITNSFNLNVIQDPNDDCIKVCSMGHCIWVCE